MAGILATELNRTIQKEAPDVFEMLSGLGRETVFARRAAPADIRVAFSCMDEKAIADLFERMFPCAREMAAEPGGGPAVPDSAFEE